MVEAATNRIQGSQISGMNHLSSRVRKYLVVEKNKLKSLPPEITNLTALVTLKLGNNQLSNLPESFGNLTSLVKLDISDNKAYIVVSVNYRDIVSITVNKEDKKTDLYFNGYIIKVF